MLKRTVLLLSLLALAAAAGCAPQPTQPTPGITLPEGTLPPPAASATPVIITATAPAADATAPPPAVTTAPTALPTSPPASQPTSTQPLLATATRAATLPGSDGQVPTVAVTPLGADAVMILIALEDNGASGEMIGCGDSAIPVRLGEPPAGQDAARFAVDRLLGMQEAYYGESGLYHVLYQSDLAVDELSESGDVITLRLSGQLMLGGVCDSPRVQAQLEGTLLANSGAARAEIFVNGEPLEDALSLQ